MIKIENVVLPSPEQMKAVIRGMRNPKNSWEKSDSYSTHVEDEETLETADFQFFLCDNDRRLMTTLAMAGTEHRKFLRMMPVYLDITAPLYWWKEFDTYKVGTVRNSCSTMHKLTEKPFTLDDFSHEHLFGYNDETHDVDEPLGILNIVIDTLNDWRDAYLTDKDKDEWWQLIQLLPSSYNQRATVELNYEVLLNIYKHRKNHKLDEWRAFCDLVETLPYMEVFLA